MFKRFIVPVIIVFVLVIGGLIYFLVFRKPAEKPPLVSEEKTLEEMIKSVTGFPREKPLSPEEWQKEKQRIEKMVESTTAPSKK